MSTLASPGEEGVQRPGARVPRWSVTDAPGSRLDECGELKKGTTTSNERVVQSAKWSSDLGSSLRRQDDMISLLKADVALRISLVLQHTNSALHHGHGPASLPILVELVPSWPPSCEQNAVDATRRSAAILGRVAADSTQAPLPSVEAFKARKQTSSRVCSTQ